MQREAGREGKRWGERERETETKREGERDRGKERDRERQKQREKEREAQRVRKQERELTHLTKYVWQWTIVNQIYLVIVITQLWKDISGSVGFEILKNTSTFHEGKYNKRSGASIEAHTIQFHHIGV